MGTEKVLCESAGALKTTACIPCLLRVCNGGFGRGHGTREVKGGDIGLEESLCGLGLGVLQWGKTTDSGRQLHYRKRPKTLTTNCNGGHKLFRVPKLFSSMREYIAKACSSSRQITKQECSPRSVVNIRVFRILPDINFIRITIKRGL